MGIDTARARLLASTVIAGAALLVAGQAFAQAAKEVDEVVVTGSRIKRAETTTPAPVGVIDAQEQIGRAHV